MKSKTKTLKELIKKDCWWLGLLFILLGTNPSVKQIGLASSSPEKLGVLAGWIVGSYFWAIILIALFRGLQVLWGHLSSKILRRKTK
ncbi:MAG: hypothetical protein PHG05_04435 [Candidatus Nanoarchaeia archaeon]|nr:hypothetical protein [Candidatus Nanoarchaeia archaeon]